MVVKVVVGVFRIFLGFKGLDKFLVSFDGDIIVINDGVIILK